MLRYALMALTVFMSVSIAYAAEPTAPPACTHYASPSGSGSACTIGAPCITQTWAQSASFAVAGNTLCLLDGVYTNSAGGTIITGGSLSGSAGSPITVRALNDGAVTLDAENGYFAVLLDSGNNYWHIWGMNAKNGYEAIYRIKGSHNRIFRSIGYNGTSGRDDSNAFFFGGAGVDNMCIDCAGWGMNMRKMFESSQSTASGGDQQFSGCTRCWFEWNDHPQGTSNPNDAVQAGYRARQQRYHNVITSWNELGNNGELEGNFTTFFDCDRSDNSMSNTEIYGSFNYLLAAHTFNAAQLYNNWCVSDLKIQDMLNFVQSGAHAGVKPHYFGRLTSFTESGNTCTRCAAVHNGTAGTVDNNTGWTFSPAMRQGSSLSAALSGASVWTELPGLCFRYEEGSLTSTPLWPWPMNQRIIDARSAGGFAATDVTATVATLLGTIPTECTTGGEPPPSLVKNRINAAY